MVVDRFSKASRFIILVKLPKAMVTSEILISDMGAQFVSWF